MKNKQYATPKLKFGNIQCIKLLLFLFIKLMIYQIKKLVNRQGGNYARKQQIKRNT